MSAPASELRRGRLSADEIASIERLAERGLKSGQIAQRLNRHPSTIGFAMATRGLRIAKPGTNDLVEIKRGASVVRRFTRDEDVFIEALRVQGFTFQQIAEIAGRRFGYRRSAATMGIRLKMIGAAE